MQRGAILAPCDCPSPVPGPPILPEPRSTPAQPCPRAPPTNQPCSQPPDTRPRAQANQSHKSPSAAVSAANLHQKRMGTTAAASAHAQVDLRIPSNWRPRAPRAPMPSRVCARKGRNGVPDQLQGRKGVLGGREGTPISANLPRFPTTPVCGKWGGLSMEAIQGARRAGVPRLPSAMTLVMKLPSRSCSAAGYLLLQPLPKRC